MVLDGAQAYQLGGALLAALIIFIAAYAAPMRISVGLLILMIPFQPVATSYGSANVVMTYVLAGALLVRGRLQYAPMLGSILFVMFAYMLTVSQVPRSVYVLHGIELIALLSGFLVFILAYNLARETENRRYVMNVLIWGNVLAVIYCVVQLTVAPGESMQIFGVKELAMNQNRGGGDARLVGPFGTPGITAAYLMTMTLILVYEIVNTEGRRRLLVSLLAASNLAMMLATANRGSFLVLLVCLLGFLFLFRDKLGFSRIVQIVVVATVVIFGSATFVASYTEFGSMFDRLAASTETDDGLPATRAKVWPIAWENIKERPLLGHGPRLVSVHERRFRRLPPEQLVGPYPHSLYLHLLVTVGIVGTLAMLNFLIGVGVRIYKGLKHGKHESDYSRGLVLMGILVVMAFLVDELKIEFLRNTTVDYAHFVFAIFGTFLGWADAARAEARVPDKVKDRVAVGPAQPARRTVAAE